jgi:hypothetical protein
MIKTSISPNYKRERPLGKQRGHAPFPKKKKEPSSSQFVVVNSLVRPPSKSFSIDSPFASPSVMDAELATIASQLVKDGGILASDESPPTLGKRLVKAGLNNDEVRN